MNALTAYWQSLSARERTLVAVGVVVSVLVIAYLYLWEPWQQSIVQLRAGLPEKQQTVIWMEREAARVKPLLGKPVVERAAQAGPLLTVIELSAGEAGLRSFARRIQPTPEGEVRVWFNQAPFDPWLRWLDDLRRKGIEVSSTTVSRGDENRVNIRVTLQRSS